MKMQPIEICDADVQTLKRLPRILACEGFVDAYTIYGYLNLRLDLWEADLDLLPPRLRILFSLFLLARPVKRAELTSVLPDEQIRALQNLGILLEEGGTLHTGNMILLPTAGLFLFAQRPGVNPIAYFGEDSAALAMHLTPSRGDICLDLCSGPGIQALLSATRAERVVAVEINPLAAAHAELNAVMNNLEHKVQVRIGDLFQAVPECEFDFICANPPLLPFPPELPYPFVGHGGADGLAVTRRILTGLRAALKPGGLCQIIGTCTGNWDGPACEIELRQFAEREGLRILMTIPSATALVRGSRMFDGLAWTCAEAAGIDREQVQDRLEQHLNQLDATHLYLFFLAITRDPHHPRFEITRHFEDHAGFWYIHR